MWHILKVKYIWNYGKYDDVGLLKYWMIAEFARRVC